MAHNCAHSGAQVEQPDPEPTQRKTGTEQTQPVDVELLRAVASLKVSSQVRDRVGGLGGLTVKEIADTYEAVKRDAENPLTVPPIRDIDATVASRLLQARGESMPTRKRGNLNGSLQSVVGQLQAIRRNRGTA